MLEASSVAPASVPVSGSRPGSLREMQPKVLSFMPPGPAAVALEPTPQAAQMRV